MFLYIKTFLVVPQTTNNELCYVEAAAVSGKALEGIKVQMYKKVVSTCQIDVQMQYYNLVKCARNLLCQNIFNL